MTTSYNLANIRTLLIEGFTDEELRRLCYDIPDFRPVYDQLARNTGKAEIVDRLIEYADQKLQIENLLSWTKEHNLTRYEKHQPYYNTSVITEEYLKIGHCQICGKECAADSMGQTPKFCSLGCRQKGYALWDKDWFIGDGEARRLINILRDSGYRNEEQNARILEELSQLHGELKSAIWALLGIAHDESIQLVLRHNITNSIKKISKDCESIVTIELNEAIRDESNQVIKTALLALCEFSDKSNIFEPYVEEALQSEDNGVRFAAIRLLGEIGQINTLIEHLEHSNKIGDSDYIFDILVHKPAIKELRQLALYNREYWIRKEAIESLEKLTQSRYYHHTDVMRNEAIKVFESIKSPLGINIKCVNCDQDVPIQFSMASQKIDKIGEVTSLTESEETWDIVSECSFCKTIIGVKLVEDMRIKIDEEIQKLRARPKGEAYKNHNKSNSDETNEGLSK